MAAIAAVGVSVRSGGQAEQHQLQYDNTEAASKAAPPYVAI